MKKGLLIDLTLCIGCEACVEACKVQNELPDEVDEVLTAYTWTTLETYENREGDEGYLRKLCMHCEKPACASVCPVGAFKKNETGAVTYESHKCIGCRYCMVACPFSVPKYQWEKAFPYVQKCILCHDLIKEGEQTACAEACPTEATLFGDRKTILQIAKSRILKDPEKYVDYIFGETEVGGTSVMYLSDVPFEKLGFRTDLIKKPLPSLTWGVMSLVPNIISLGGLGLFGTWWIINRRIKLAKEKLEQQEKSEETNN
jgi:formate dehydrogenase iron-sulfur subunit